MFVVGQQYARRKTALQMKEVAYAAAVLQEIFDRAESLICEGMSPRNFRRNVLCWAREAGAVMSAAQINFCRQGYIHPPFGDDVPLQKGEIFTLDMWLSCRGWYADLARPYCVGMPTEDQRRLLQAALSCQECTIQTIFPGKPYLSLVQAVEKEAQKYNCYVLEEACGHGIGRNLHEDPLIAFTHAGQNLFDPIPLGLVVTLEVALSLKKCFLVQDGQGCVRSNNGTTVLYAEAMVALDDNGVHVLGR